MTLSVSLQLEDLLLYRSLQVLGPGALPDDRSFIAFTVSETVWNSSSSGLRSTVVC